MTALKQLAARLRLNAASMEHGAAEEDIRAAADILDAFADVGEIEYSDNAYSPFRDANTKCLRSSRQIARAFTCAYIRASGRSIG